MRLNASGSVAERFRGELAAKTTGSIAAVKQIGHLLAEENGQDNTDDCRCYSHHCGFQTELKTDLPVGSSDRFHNSDLSDALADHKDHRK